MFNRFTTALQIQEGACNPRPIAKALLDSIDACRAEGKNEREDSAVFLILHQLTWVLTGNDIALSPNTVDRFMSSMTACENHWYNNCPNLDAASTEELVAFVDKYALGDPRAELFPACKDSEKHVNSLVLFASFTISARQLRLEANISAAVELEKAADEAYRSLGDKFRSW